MKWIVVIAFSLTIAMHIILFPAISILYLFRNLSIVTCILLRNPPPSICKLATMRIISHNAII